MTRHAATMPIFEVMTSGPITVRPETTVEDLLNLFDRHDFNAFPVVAADGTLRGIVSKLDVLRLLHPDEQFRLPDPKAIAATPVSTIMRPGALTVEAEDPVVVAADLMVALYDTSVAFDHVRQRIQIVANLLLGPESRDLEDAYRRAAGRIEEMARRLSSPSPGRDDRLRQPVELAVHVDAQGLEGPRRRMNAGLPIASCAVDQVGQVLSGLYRIALLTAFNDPLGNPA